MIKIIPRDKIKHLEWNEGEDFKSPEPVNQAPAPQTSTNFNFNKTPEESFIMSYDGVHKDFFQELITKVNEIYKGTKAEISTGTRGEVQGNLIKRMGIISTIANDSNLRSYGLFPINPVQSEYLLKNGKLTNPSDNWEDLGMVLYDLKGENEKEAKAIYESIKNNRTALGLSESDLEKKLIIANPGVEVDSSMPHGVKPIVIPGITQVYYHEVLEKVGEDTDFEGYGLEGGLPLIKQLGSGKRKLWMPDETKKIGLRLLFRGRDSSLGARVRFLADSGSEGRVNFARSAST
ncbi:MAG: hypothetical protein KC516_02490 [Nanoarchaeota archaeon]|nr:hypothetical protein [Nanoarchaeota archaeon]